VKFAEEFDNDYCLATFIATLAGPTAALGAPERAARLLGVADALQESIGARHQPADRPEINRYLDAFARNWAKRSFRKPGSGAARP
jgi:hypothetical protein